MRKYGAGLQPVGRHRQALSNRTLPTTTPIRERYGPSIRRQRRCSAAAAARRRRHHRHHRRCCRCCRCCHVGIRRRRRGGKLRIGAGRATLHAARQPTHAAANWSVHSPVRCAAAALPAARQRSTAATADTRSSVDVGLAVVGPRLAVLFFVEHQLVVRVVTVIKVSRRILGWHLNCDSTREDRCGESQASVDVDGCAGRILTTGKRRARTASAACQGTRQSSARHGVSARCAAYRLARLHPDRMPCCTRRRRRMRSLAVIKSTTSREELQEGDNNPSEQCAGEFLSRRASGRP